MKHVGIARSRIFRSLIVAISLSAAGVAVADGHLNVESKLVGLPPRLPDSLQLHGRRPNGF
jgi:hypothetical protein